MILFNLSLVRILLTIKKCVYFTFRQANNQAITVTENINKINFHKQC